MPRAVIIRNPASRRAISHERLDAARRALGGAWEVRVLDSTPEHGVAQLAHDAATGGVEYVLACGGDGTLNEVVNGVVEAGRREVVVGLLPAGTANVWATEVRIPSDPTAALRLLEAGQVVSLDVGRVQTPGLDRRFLLMCSVGFDAAVVERVERWKRLKRGLAQGAYLVAGAVSIVRERPAPVGIDGRDTEDEVLMALAGNSRLYGGVTRLASDACMDDGMLDLVVFRTRPGWRGLRDATRHLARAVTRIHRPWHQLRAPRFEYRRAPSFTLTPGRPVAVQCDGEFIVRVPGGHPVTLSAEPAALRLLVPREPQPLFPAAVMSAR